jgi:hypothetical protein
VAEIGSVLGIDAAGVEVRLKFWTGLWGISQFGTFEILSKGCSSQGGAVEGCGKADLARRRWDYHGPSDTQHGSSGELKGNVSWVWLDRPFVFMWLV